MGQLSAKCDDDLEAAVEEFADEETDGNRSEAIRELVRRGLEFDDVVDDLEGDLDRAEARVQELENQLAARQQREEDVQELVEYVEDEERYRQAGLLTRAKWWLTGMPDESETDDGER